MIPDMGRDSGGNSGEIAPSEWRWFGSAAAGHMEMCRKYARLAADRPRAGEGAP